GRSAQLLDQQLEPEVGAPRDAEALVAVREGARASRTAVAAPLVPGDQLLARGDHRHVHLAGAPALADLPLGLLDDRPAESAALERGADREHPEIGLLAAALQLTAGDYAAVALDGQQPAVRGLDDLQHALRVGALPVQEVRLGGPPGPAGVAPVGRLD